MNTTDPGPKLSVIELFSQTLDALITNHKVLTSDEAIEALEFLLNRYRSWKKE